MPLGFKVKETIGSLGKTTFCKWQQRGLVLEGPVRRDLSEEGRERSQSFQGKGTGHSPQTFLLRIIQVENSTHSRRFHPHSAKPGREWGDHKKPELPSLAQLPCPPPQPQYTDSPAATKPWALWGVLQGLSIFLHPGSLARGRCWWGTAREGGHPFDTNGLTGWAGGPTAQH